MEVRYCYNIEPNKTRKDRLMIEKAFYFDLFKTSDLLEKTLCLVKTLGSRYWWCSAIGTRGSRYEYIPLASLSVQCTNNQV